MTKTGDFYRQYLLNDVVPFWMQYGVDKEHGGFLTALEQNGSLFSEDKSVWFQGRGTWVFSKLYNSIKKDKSYLDAAQSGFEFLKKCIDNDNRMFFIVKRDASPIQKRRYYFSETFAAIACAEYYTASGNKEALQLSRNLFELIDYLYRNPTVLPSKYYADNLNVKALAVPMILLSTAQVLRSHDKEKQKYYDDFISEMLNEIINGGFFDENRKALFEFASVDKTPVGGPRGRLVNPGHSIEAAWFIAIEALKRNDKTLLEKALLILDWSLDLGWDKTYDGLFYFTDIDGKPTEQIEWDMKLWWPHTEALYASALAWKVTRDEKYKIWLNTIHDYSFSRFSDNEYGEWFGYLHRDGSPASTLKGNMFKGPFHLPRALILISELLNRDDMSGYFPL